MIHVNMLSSATRVKGQGVGSAYTELVRLLRTYLSADITVTENDWHASTITHYHTVDPQFYLSTFDSRRGRRIGYVHFLPETLEGSLKLPGIIGTTFNKYLISFYKRMDRLVVVNPSFIPQLAAYGIPEEKVRYIPNFVAKREFYPVDAAEKGRLRRQHQLHPGRFTVLGVGQVQERKGVGDFITLAKRHPEIDFVWVGGFSFGKMTAGYTRLKEVVDNPPVNLIFPGIVDRDKMRKYYNMADLFLLPSYNELFPMSILEAFSCGIPVLVRELPLYHDIISGFYAGAADVQAMDQQIVTLRDNPERLRALRSQAEAGAQQYSEDRLATVWRDFYKAEAMEGHVTEK